MAADVVITEARNGLRDGRTWPIDATAERRRAGLVGAPELEAHIRALNGWLAGD